jgi:hypothetical protein
LTTAQIAALVMAQVDDATGASFTPASPPNTAPPEVVSAINEGQQLAAWLTLCLEKTAAFPIGATHSLDPNGCFYQVRPVLTDFLVPLRLTLGGVRLRPAGLAQLDAENDAWQATASTPARYACLGFNLLIVTPQASVTTQMTYAYSPPALVQDADTPVIPEAYHSSLVDYGVYRIRLKEGAQALARGMERLGTFLDDMTKLAEYIRERSVAARYDVTPFELALFDRSQLIEEVLKWQASSTPRR